MLEKKNKLINKKCIYALKFQIVYRKNLCHNGLLFIILACNVYKKAFLDKDGKNNFLTPILMDETILRSGEFPFIAALGYKKNKDNSKLIDYRCGGTLITTEHILTAAHCVSNADNNVPVEVYQNLNY